MSDIFGELLSFVDKCLKKKHKPDLELVKKHNADPLNKEWKIPEGELWEQSDVVHDLLAYLAEQMIEMNKEKQKFIIEFLNWLENEFIKDSIENLKNKTKIKNFYDYPFESVIEVLKLNKLLPKFIRPDDNRYKMLKTAFERAIFKLSPLKRKISRTDNLIDQIVYKLYGLTKEEIKIVEGNYK